MKKIVALFLSMVLAIGCFAGCGGSAGAKAKVIEIELTSEEYAFGVDKTQPELLTSVNAFIAEIQANGKFDVQLECDGAGVFDHGAGLCAAQMADHR